MAAQDHPICLIVPGLDNSGPGHWQTLWEQRRGDCSRVDLECWSDPDRAIWVDRVDRAVSGSSSPVILVAHSLGCLAVVWWAQRGGDTGKVLGAILVAPPDVDRTDALPVVRRFAPAPRTALPFPSLLVASRNDPYADFAALEALANRWGSKLIDAGFSGHINAGSGLGAWPDGERLLEEMLAGSNEGRRAATG